MRVATDIELVWLFDIAEPVKVLSICVIYVSSITAAPYFCYQYR